MASEFDSILREVLLEAPPSSAGTRGAGRLGEQFFRVIISMLASSAPSSPPALCRFGAACYLQSPEHRLQHPAGWVPQPQPHSSSTHPVRSARCPFGRACYRTNAEHRFSMHEPGWTPQPKPASWTRRPAPTPARAPYSSGPAATSARASYLDTWKRQPTAPTPTPSTTGVSETKETRRGSTASYMRDFCDEFSNCLGSKSAAPAACSAAGTDPGKRSAPAGRSHSVPPTKRR